MNKKYLQKQISISAFFPCYNDAGSIAIVVQDAYETLKKITYDFEIIVVDDASRDESVNVVQGFKIMRQDPYYRLLIGNLYHYFSKILFGLKIRDVDCDFRLIRKRALDSISLKYDSGVICVELVKKLQDKGFKFAEVGVHHYPRAYGHSQFFNYKRIFKTLIELLQLWLNLILLRTG